MDGASGDDRQQSLGLAIAKHLNPCYGVYMMNCAHPSIIFESLKAGERDAILFVQELHADLLLNAWCELAKSLKSKGGFTDTQTESRLVQRITPLFSMTASQQLTPSVSDFLLSRICGIHAPERLCPCPSHLLHASSAYGGRR